MNKRFERFDISEVDKYPTRHIQVWKCRDHSLRNPMDERNSFVRYKNIRYTAGIRCMVVRYMEVRCMGVHYIGVRCIVVRCVSFYRDSLYEGSLYRSAQYQGSLYRGTLY